MNVHEFVKMLSTGIEPEVLDGFKSKIADGIYKVGEGEYRVNGHEAGGIDHIVKVVGDGLIKLYEQQRP